MYVSEKVINVFVFVYFTSMCYSWFKDRFERSVAYFSDVTGFCQIYLQTDVETAITQNSKRDVKVTDDVIIAMATKMEPPDMSRNSWEEYSVTYSAESDL